MDNKNHDEEIASTSDMFQLNKPKSIVPPMENKVGSTYAETRAELEAKKRAESLAAQAQFEAENAPVTPPKKSSIWFAVLTIVFLVIALVGTGFGVYEYTKNEELKEALAELEEKYDTAQNNREEIEAQYNSIKKQLDDLVERLGLNAAEVETPSDSENPDAAGSSAETPAETAN